MSRTTDLHGCEILIVEDEYIIALDLAQSLEELGATVIGPVASVAQALSIISTRDKPHAAVLDVNLGNEKVFPVADELVARGIPFLFATGYDHWVIPEEYRAVPRCQKPIDIRAVTHLLSSGGH